MLCLGVGEGGGANKLIGKGEERRNNKERMNWLARVLVEGEASIFMTAIPPFPLVSRSFNLPPMNAVACSHFPHPSVGASTPPLLSLWIAIFIFITVSFTVPRFW
jgi:hypothetical protein